MVGVQVSAEMKIIEIDLDEIQALGLRETLFDAQLRALPKDARDSVEANHRPANGNGPNPATGMFRVMDSDAPVLSRLRAIFEGKRGKVKVLAEPTVVTTSGGRPN